MKNFLYSNVINHLFKILGDHFDILLFFVLFIDCSIYLFFFFIVRFHSLSKMENF